MTDQTWTLGNVRGEHPAASHHVPFFITAPGETDVLLNVMIGVSLGFCFLDRNILSPTASSTRPHGEQRTEDPIRNGCGSMSMPSVEPELTVSTPSVEPEPVAKNPSRSFSQATRPTELTFVQRAYLGPADTGMLNFGVLPGGGHSDANDVSDDGSEIALALAHRGEGRGRSEFANWSSLEGVYRVASRRTQCV